MESKKNDRRYKIRTELTPEDEQLAESRLATIRLGSVTPEEFRQIFPSGCLQDAMCHEGTDADGRPHVYFAADVLESELPRQTGGAANMGSSHQVLLALALLRLEKVREPDTAELRRRAANKPLNEITPLALQHLLVASDGGWGPEQYICDDIARLASQDGIRSSDLLAPPGA